MLPGLAPLPLFLDEPPPAPIFKDPYVPPVTANLASYVNFGIAETLTLAGSSISQIVDVPYLELSNVYVQASAGSRPAIDGKVGIFDGGDQLMDASPSWTWNGLSSFTLIAVAKPTASGLGKGVFGASEASSYGITGLSVSTNRLEQRIGTGSSSTAYVTSLGSFADAAIISARKNGTTARLARNGSEVASATTRATIAGTNTQAKIGSTGSSEYFSGSIEAVLFYTRALSDAEILTTENWIKQWSSLWSSLFEW